MKIFPLTLLSPLDRAKNLMSVMKQNSEAKVLPCAATRYDKKVQVLGEEYTVRELRSLYRFIRTRMDLITQK